MALLNALSLDRTRRRASLGLMGALLLALGACAGADETTPVAPSQPLVPQQAQATPPSTEGARVALLVPLSGRASALGQDMQDAAQMALFDAQSNLQLLTRDTGDSPDQAARAAQQLLNGNARLVLGPLFGASAKAVAPIAGAKNVNVVSFSNDSTVARPGLFVLGFRPEEQIERVVRYAREQGLQRIALLAPDDAYGNLAVTAFRRTMASLDPSGESGKTIIYPATGDASGAIKAALDNGGGPYDAVLVADGGKRLGDVAQIVKGDANGANIRLLGTRRFEEDPAVLQSPALQGAWVAGIAPQATENFMSRFASTYGRRPNELAVLGYDAVGLAALLERSNTDFSAATLTDKQGFVGALSPFRLMPDGTSQHALSVMQVENGTLNVISPAPQSFEQPALTN